MTRNILKLSMAASLFVSLFGQHITLFKYDQKDSVTNCTHGLINEVDTVVFKCRVDYSKDKEAKYVYFQARKENGHEFANVKFVDLQKDCDGIYNSDCLHIDTYVIDINITVMATTDYSRALIQGKLITSNEKEIASEEQVFPEISDVTNTKGSVEINGKSVFLNGTECYTSNDDTYLQVLYKCESDVLPCVIEISDGNPTETKQDVGSLLFYQRDIDDKKTIRLGIKHNLCHMHTNSTEIECTIQTGPGPDVRFIVLATLQSILLFIVMVFFFFFHRQVTSLKKEFLSNKEKLSRWQGSLAAPNLKNDEASLLSSDTDFGEGPSTMTSTL